MAGVNGIPIIDLSPCASFDWDLTNEAVKKCADDVCDAFRHIGFVYVINHGIPQHQLDTVLLKSREFFRLPTATKLRYVRPPDATNHGYVSLKQESLNPKRSGDLKEAYNVTPQNARTWPDDVIPDFRAAMMDFFRSCTKLTNLMLRLMGHGLGLEDPEIFVKSHNYTTQPNQSTVRSLYYPPLECDVGIGDNEIRCGEHSDYGSITLLFQDHVGGLEVRNRQGDYIPATPVEGSVVVNIGDLMQRWTSDQLVSTKHRVVNPASRESRGLARQSVAFFGHPDDQHVVRCVDDSDKYQPIGALDYLKMRFSETY